jgi:uncharacterized protein (DUF58 family)
MNRRYVILLSGFLAAAAGVLVAAWAWWDSRPPPESWEVERSEQVLSGVAVGKEVKVPFRLHNRSRRTLQLLGTSAC